MRMPMIMLIESSTLSAKRWVDRLTPGAVNSWDLLKKAIIQRYCPPSKTAKRLEDIHNFKQESDESLYQAWERYNGPIPGMTPTQALAAIQTMTDHSQKWHDGTSSRNVSSNSNTDGLAAIVEDVKYGEFGRLAPFNRSNEAEFRVGPPRYYTHTINRPPYREKRLSLEELMNKH
ncbi:cysteine-rich receptor-like protein kinase [Tanacetum coccineum]